MKTYRKIVSVILIILVVLMGTVTSFGFTGSGALDTPVKAAAIPGNSKATYTISGGTLTISGSGMIPDNAFSSTSKISGLSNVTKIDIKGGITIIGEYAFTGCKNVTALSLSEGLKTIRIGAFYNCSKLKSVSVPKSVTHVQDGAFNKTYTAVSCKNSAMEKYGTYGFKTNDILRYTLSRDYDRAFKLLTLVNNQRTASKVGKLTMNANLMEVAMERGAECVILMPDTSDTNHTRPNGEKWSTIYGLAVAENLSAGGSEAATVFTKMMSNSTNKSNILDASFKSVGIGCVQFNGIHYWVMIFSTSTTAKAVSQPANKTVTTSIEFPYGTNAVTNYPTYSFKIDTGNIKLRAGTTKQATLKLGAISFIKSTTQWRSENTSVAKVSSSGLITATGPGTTKIWAGSSKTYNRTSITVTAWQILRYAGNNKYDTSIAVANAMKSKLKVSKFDSIILASASSYPDSLSGTYLAGAKNAPILLVDKSSEDKIVNYVKSNLKSGGTVYILGGTAAVPATTATKLKAYKVKRLWGSNRYKTNLAVLNEVGVSGKDLMIASGTSYADSLSSGPLRKPIMIVGKTLLQEQKDYLAKANLSGKIYVAGGSAAVSDIAFNELKKYGTIKRLWGNNRYKTALAIVNEFFKNKPDTIVIAYGQDYPGGLVGAPLAMAYDAPLLLVNKYNYEYVKTLAKSYNARRIIVVENKNIISDAIADTIGGW